MNDLTWLSVHMIFCRTQHLQLVRLPSVLATWPRELLALTKYCRCEWREVWRRNHQVTGQGLKARITLQASLCMMSMKQSRPYHSMPSLCRATPQSLGTKLVLYSLYCGFIPDCKVVLYTVWFNWYNMYHWYTSKCATCVIHIYMCGAFGVHVYRHSIYQ